MGKQPGAPPGLVGVRARRREGESGRPGWGGSGRGGHQGDHVKVLESNGEYFAWMVFKICFFSAVTSSIQIANYLYNPSNSVNNQGCWHREGHGDYKSRGILEITYAWYLPYQVAPFSFCQ